MRKRLEIVPSDSRYTPIVQQPFCCVPACISMIMLRHNIPLIPQEELGYFLGLVVPKDKQDLFWRVRTGPRPPGGYGTQISKEQFSPNHVFTKLNIPLRMKYVSVAKFKTLSTVKRYIAEIGRQNRDVLACFDYGTLYRTDFTGGHVNLIDKALPKQNTVRLIDPAYNVPKWRVVKINDLYDAMKAHNKKPGFWEFSFKNN